MAIDFPTSPTLNQVYIFNGRSWKWNGEAWESVTAAYGPTGPTGPTGSTGPTGPTGAALADITNVTAATYTLALTDAFDLVEMNSGSAQSLVIPLNSSAAFATKTEINVLQVGAGQVTVSGASGVTVNGTPGLKLRAQWSAVTLIKRATDTWVVVGDLSA